MSTTERSYMFTLVGDSARYERDDGLVVYELPIAICVGGPGAFFLNHYACRWEDRLRVVDDIRTSRAGVTHVDIFPADPDAPGEKIPTEFLGEEVAIIRVQGAR